MKAGGALGLPGGLCVATAYVLHPPAATPTVVASSFWIIIHVLFLISLICGALLLVALLGRYVSRGGRIIGAVWCVLGILSMMLILGLDYSEVFIFPVLAEEFPEVIERYGDGVSMPSIAFVFPVSGVLFLLGFSLFSYELIRTESLPKRPAAVLLVSTIVFAFGLSGFAPFLVVKVGAVLFGIGIAWVGLALMRVVSDSTGPTVAASG